MSEAAATGVLGRLAALGAELRARGVRVGTGELAVAARALARVDAADREAVRLALRPVLCSRHEDLAAFDAAFDAVFGPGDAAGGGPPPLPPGLQELLPTVPAGSAPPPRAGEGGEEPEVRPAAWSEVELLRERDAAELTEAELAAVHRLIVRLARRGPTRRSRRLRPTHRPGRRLDLPATVRASLRHGGEPVHRRWRAPGRAPRPVVLVVDVSGSMAPYAGLLLRYAQALVTARPRVEAFALGTRLTRVTRELRSKDVDAALDRATRAAAAHGGGPRLGDGIAELNRRHGRRIGRGAVVVVLSDGWDRGDPQRLGDEMARLARTAHRVVWLNPLKARPGYEPLARGMAAALPHVDVFLEGHSLGSLEALADVLEGPMTREVRR
ncbi:MAG: VWA domain-containing protein [Solirubrobacteraceae bacterium]|nr:VWA domain-containing protein [Solirubrobacteraceae bacterium]